MSRCGRCGGAIITEVVTDHIDRRFNGDRRVVCLACGREPGAVVATAVAERPAAVWLCFCSERFASERARRQHTARCPRWRDAVANGRRHGGWGDGSIVLEASGRASWPER